MLEVDQLAFETAEEIFCHGVVVGIVLAGHALPDSIEDSRRSRKATAAYWTSRSLCKMSPLGGLQRHTAMSRDSKGGSVNAVAKGIVYNFSGTQVLNDGQVEPAFPSENVGDIARLCLIWTFKEEISVEQIGSSGVPVSGVGYGFVSPASHRGNPRNPHLTVDPLAETAESRFLDFVVV